MSRRALQVTLRVLAVAAVFFGALTALGGAPTIIGAGDASVTLDSELRYFSAWYVAAGIFLLRATPRVEAEGFTIRILMATLFFGGFSRVIGTIANGVPHPVSLTLMVLELTIPVVILPWQAAVARGRKPPSS